jgi:endonuclease YncB( thermonuclease family)
MFRRKKPEGGFEWHEYIRTTIKVRRDARRQHVKDARRAAGQQMQAAGVALAAGSRAAGGAAVQGARAGVGALGLVVQALWTLSVHVVRAVLRPVVALASRPNIGGPLAFAGAIALGAGLGRARSVGLDREATATLLIGAILTLCLLPILGRRTTWRPPLIVRQAASWAAGLAIVAGGAAWLASATGMAGLGKLASLDRLPLIGAGEPLRGTAYAEGADRLRIADTLVRLGGIEAPEAAQQCDRSGKAWRCGAAAESALARLVNGRRLSCTLSGSDDAGRPLGRCTIGTRGVAKDVAAELVRQGHVFAEGGLLPRYASEEREARVAKAGLWSGDAERPADWRAKVWEDAKGRSPEGCPIKGQVTGSARLYVLPWSPEYERARVQKTRGERWFCSEQEAVAAGFKARG